MTSLDLEHIGEFGTILSVWAHPDDETFLAGGIMATAAAAGQRVVCVSATAGELGTDDPVTWPPARLGQVRRWEAAAAMAVLGVDDHRFLDLPDGGLAAIDPDGPTGPVARIAAIIEEVAPDTILTFGPDGGTLHPDHQAVSRWVSAAVAVAAGAGAGRLLQVSFSAEHWAIWGPRYEEWGVFMSDERPVPVPAAQLAVNIQLDGALMDRKIAALAAMYTQISPSIALLGVDTFREMNRTESFVDATQR